MSRIRIPLQFRIILLLGCALTALQLVLGAGYIATVDESVALQRKTLKRSAQDALESRVREAAAVQASSLELIAELGRQQNYVIIEKKVTQTREQRSGPRRLRGSQVKQEVQTTQHRLEDLVDGLTEYGTARMILWLLTEAGSMAELSGEQQAQATRLEAETVGTASRVFCDEQSCWLMTVRPFQTRDGVQITAVQASALDALLQGVDGGGQVLSWIHAGQDAAPAERAGEQWIGPLPELGGVALDSGEVYASVPASQEIARFLAARDRYIRIAAGGVLLSLLLIAISLRGVLSRVGVLIEALPMLTEQRFEDARDKLAGAVRRSRGRDETEVMLQVAADVSTQLQALTEELKVKAGELAAERDRMALLLDTVPAFVLLVDAQGRIHAANALCCSSIGLDEAQILGRPLHALMPPEAYARFERAIGAVADAGSSRSLEARLQDAQGNELDVEWQLRPVDDPQSGTRLVLSAGQDVTDLKVMERRFHWLRDHDELTGLLNGDALQRRLQSATRQGTLVYLLLQREQVINAALPEPGRSALTQHLAEVLRAANGGRDKQWLAVLADRTVAVYIPGADSAAAAAVSDFADSLRARPFEFNGAVYELALQPVYVQLKGNESPDILQDLLAGCETRPQIGESPWLNAADAVSRQHQEHRSWVREIDLALDEDRLYLEYQPIFKLPGLQVSHSEALVRMRGRNGERVPPGLFIPHAERSGQIIDLERRVFDMAIAKSVQLREAGRRHPLAVNLAAASLHDDVLLQRLEQATQDESLPFGSLCLEIVETAAIRNMDAARSLLQRFKSRGMHIALDDFGVGFTSFEYVRELPFDTVKIDQVFVRELSRRPQDRQLIASINELVHGLGRQTIAEGVEDQAALQMLRSVGVDAVQGYYLGRPEEEIRLQPLAGFEQPESQVA